LVSWAARFGRRRIQIQLPEPVTPIARETLHIHNEFMLIITILFVVVFAIMIYSMIKHRKSAATSPRNSPVRRVRCSGSGPGPVRHPALHRLHPDGHPGSPGNHHDGRHQDSADMVLKVTGMQWKWQYEYPEAGIKFISTLSTPRDQIANAEAKGEHYLLEVDKPVVLPVGKKVRILLTSTDVIHTWWVPQFGVKRDAVPGFLRETWV
jgi:cytochrome c oxidase subunit 2